MTKKSLVLHPFFMAIYPVLFLLSKNIGQFYLSTILQPMFLILLGTLVAWLFLGFALKNYHKAGIIVSLFLLLFFSFGHVKSLLGDKGTILVMLPSWFAIFSIGLLIIVGLKKSFREVTKILNVIAGILVAFSMFSIIAGQFSTTGWRSRPDAGIDVTANAEHNEKVGDYPDIYFIILDAYTRNDVLKEIYDFDNSEFLAYLRDKGFYIADRSSANYGQTGLTLGACFNLIYLDELVKYIGQNNMSHAPLKYYIANSFIIRYLKERGYTFVSFATEVFDTNFQDADIYLQSGVSLNIFWNALKNFTPMPYIELRKKSRDAFDIHRDNILHIFDSLGDVAQLNTGPKFVFAHIEVPHPPFVFGPNGEPVKIEKIYNDHDGDWLIRPGRLSLAEYLKRYRDHVIFTNKKMKKTVDKILSNLRRPPIILIIGDHGPRSGTVWHDPEMTNMKEHLTILSAYYLPEDGNKLLYPEITPVNIFRVILNHYFGENFTLLPDRNYFSTAQYLYKFYDVTNYVQGDTEVDMKDKKF